MPISVRVLRAMCENTGLNRHPPKFAGNLAHVKGLREVNESPFRTSEIIWRESPFVTKAVLNRVAAGNLNVYTGSIP